VIAVDMQPEMLARVAKKAGRKGVSERIICHQCKPDRIGLGQKADFILAYYMVHETPDTVDFFRQTKALLKENGRMLVVEPKMHVSKTQFQSMLTVAEKAGLKAEEYPRKKGGHAAVFVR
jgi:ubiquinone/menaquinone biosynthesis C-methylase UbiE